MFVGLIVLHVLVSLFLVMVVLLQAGKGGGMGVALGGGSSHTTVLGAGGATTLLGKMTVAAAATFMVTSMSLAYLSSNSTISIPDGADANAPAAAAADPADKADGTAAPAAPADEAPADKAPADKAPAAPVDKAPADKAPAAPADKAPAAPADGEAGEGSPGVPGPDGNSTEPPIPGAIYKNNKDGTGSVEFDMVYDPDAGEWKPEAPDPSFVPGNNEQVVDGIPVVGKDPNAADKAPADAPADKAPAAPEDKAGDK